MNVKFCRGPWNSAEINLKRLPTWITFSADVWTGGSNNVSVDQTQVLSEPYEFTYLLEKNEDGSFQYVLRVVQEP